MYRKLAAAALCAALSLSALTPSAFASGRAVPVTVDGVRLSAGGYLADGVTAVPMRTLLDAAGGWTVAWDGENQLAVAYNEEGLTLSTRPGESTVWVGDSPHAAPMATYVLQGRTYIPLRLVCEALGWSVKWDAALGGAAVTTGEAQWTQEDLYWLSRVISAESRGEPMEGQLAVGRVVMNRVASPEFPDTIKGVVFDRKNGVQFEPVSNGTIYQEPTAQSVTAAKAILSGAESVVGDCLYFFAPELSEGTWIRRNRTYYTTVGCHRFYL